MIIAATIIGFGFFFVFAMFMIGLIVFFEHILPRLL